MKVLSKMMGSPFLEWCSIWCWLNAGCEWCSIVILHSGCDDLLCLNVSL